MLLRLVIKHLCVEMDMDYLKSIGGDADDEGQRPVDASALN